MQSLNNLEEAKKYKVLADLKVQLLETKQEAKRLGDIRDKVMEEFRQKQVDLGEIKEKIKLEEEKKADHELKIE